VADQDWLTQRFEEHRSRLEAVAYRMLGSRSDADDAVQEAWLRLSRTESGTESGTVDNLGGWLTTVVGRVCLDMLRSRAAHREQPLGDHLPQAPATPCDEGDPEEEALMAESVGLALLVVLDTLAPAERLAFVLHDMFAVPFDEIAPILRRSPNAAKQLASRARRRVQAANATRSAGAGPSAGAGSNAGATRQTELVRAFLAASRNGDFAALLEALDPEVVLRADPTAIQAGALAEIRGAPAVANQFAERAVETLPTLVAQAPGTVWAITPKTPRAAFGFTIKHAKIVHIDLVFDPLKLRQLDVAISDRIISTWPRLHSVVTGVRHGLRRTANSVQVCKCRRLRA
jgi:RNA polymerase sigma-70 factor, ECF subfamily